MHHHWLNSGLLTLRLGLGAIFAVHGAQKAFVYGLDGVAGMFGGLGIPFPELNALIVTAVELVGGLALATGALTRLAAPLLAFTMAVAIGTVHAANGFFMADNGYEFPLILLAASLALTMTGPGAYSVDAWLSTRTRLADAPRQRLGAAA